MSPTYIFLCYNYNFLAFGVQSFEVKELQPLGLMVQQLQLSNYERVTRPSQYMEELQASQTTRLFNSKQSGY